ncbi:Acg family FMN-binding oxidoreductase [Leptothrix discophora]|uniref:Tat pathway signal protein n=1 Tax=Leptothrix discophora TaxID=89 RepID=A0ABT9G909_LEPDI|nr:Tat pathway signal protein [Leptothrix discophora]MDP4302673.1 Tat pathway signal protein [Leptothrix discophora]
MITRRQFAVSTPLLAASALASSGCTSEPASDGYEAVAERTWQQGAVTDLSGAALGRELVRCATLAPSSHNSQCWKFALDANLRWISVLPDPARRCPAVDPDNHHVFVSLGCAIENLIQAALAHGLQGDAKFDAAGNAVRVLLEPTRAQTTPLFTALSLRQCTRGHYDGKALSSEELALLQRAGSSDTVRLLLLTERAAMEQTLEYVIQGNSAQLADVAFVNELKDWIRFNGADAIRMRDGLYSASSGNPNIPSWIGDVAFRWLLTAKGENDKYVRQVRSSAGIAVFVGQAADKAHWVEVGRCYERFALQATALGIRNAFLNQPVEVAALRPPFAAALGLSGQRPDLVVRFGRGPVLPRSLRRPVEAVLV